MKECFNMSCKHFAFRGKHIKCKSCGEITPLPTGEICVRCGKEIYKYQGERWGGCINYLCIECTDEAHKIPHNESFGMAIDANPRYCYWIETGKIMPMENALRIANIEIDYNNLTPEEQKMYNHALKAFNRMKGHSMIGGMWIK